MLLLGWPPYVSDAHPVLGFGGNEDGVVSKELMQPAHDVHASAHGLEDDAPIVDREQTAGWCDSEDEHARCGPCGRDCVREVSADRDVPPRFAKCLPGVAAGVLAVDDGHDLVLLGMAHQAVRGLSVDRAEVGLAVHHRVLSTRRDDMHAFSVRERGT